MHQFDQDTFDTFKQVYAVRPEMLALAKTRQLSVMRFNRLCA